MKALIKGHDFDRSAQSGSVHTHLDILQRVSMECEGLKVGQTRKFVDLIQATYSVGVEIQYTQVLKSRDILWDIPYAEEFKMFKC